MVVAVVVEGVSCLFLWMPKGTITLSGPLPLLRVMLMLMLMVMVMVMLLMLQLLSMQNHLSQ